MPKVPLRDRLEEVQDKLEETQVIVADLKATNTYLNGQSVNLKTEKDRYKRAFEFRDNELKKAKAEIETHKKEVKSYQQLASSNNKNADRWMDKYYKLYDGSYQWCLLILWTEILVGLGWGILWLIMHLRVHLI